MMNYFFHKKRFRYKGNGDPDLPSGTGNYRCDQWAMRQNHAGRRNNNGLDDPNLLLISVGHEAELCRP